MITNGLDSIEDKCQLNIYLGAIMCILMFRAWCNRIFGKIENFEKLVMEIFMDFCKNLNFENAFLINNIF